MTENHKPRSSTWRLGRLWNRLTEPADSIKEPGRRRQARLLSALLVSLIAVTVPATVVLGLRMPYRFVLQNPVIPLIMSIDVLLSLAYGLNRAGRYTVAAALAVGISNIGAFAMAINSFLGGTPYASDDVNLLVYIVVPVLFGGILLSIPALIAIVALNMVGMLILPVLFPQITFSSIIVGPFSFVLTVSILVVLATQYRNRLERDRQAELVEKKDTLQQQTAQLEALRQVGLELVAQLDMDALLHSIVSQAMELMGGDSGGLYLYRPEQDVLEWIVPIGPAATAPVGTILHRGEGLSGKVWETGEPLIVDDYAKWEGYAILWEDYPTAAVVGIPIRWGEEFLGVLNVGASGLHTFSPTDVDLLSLFATQAAITIQNARLFEMERRRTSQLAAVAKVAEQITSILSLDELLRETVELIVQTFDYYHAIIMLLDAEADELVFKVGVGGYAGRLSVDYRQKAKEGMIGWTVHLGETLLANDVSQEPRYIPTYLETRSELDIPLKYHDREIGVLDLQSKEPNAFSQHDVTAMEALAGHIATAIENARLYGQARHEITERKQAEEEAQRRAAQAALIYQVGQRVSGELELGELSSTIVTTVRDAFDYYGVVLLLLDEEAKCLTMHSIAGNYAGLFPEGLQLAIGEGITGYAAATGETQISGDISQDSHYVQRAKVETKSELATPIKSGQNVIGVLDLQSDEFDAFDETDVMVMETLADQAAVAIENARLYKQAQREIIERKQAEEALQRRNRELALLHYSSQAFSSTLDLDQVLATVLEKARHLMDAVGCSIWLLDPTTDELVCRQATDPQSELVRGWRLTPGRGLADWVARHGESLIVPDTRSDERHFKGVDQKTELELRSILSVPLRVKQGVIGVLQVVDTEVNQFDGSDLALLEPLAASAASAIENARLYEQARQEIVERKKAAEALQESEKRLRQQEQLAAIGQLAGGIAHDFNNFLTTIILQAQISMGKRDLPPGLMRSFEIIFDESQRAASLVQQILDFSRRSAMETYPVDLASLTEEVINVLQRTIQENVHLISDAQGAELGEYVAPLTVEADPTRIHQVLLNLATNARDAMPEDGELWIGLARVEVKPGEKPPLAGMDAGEWVCLTVSDTGAGIPPDVLPHIFEPFFTTKEQGKGTGLGLAQVYGIVAQHKGHIGVETTVGKGTTFRIYLPAYHAGEEKIPLKEKALVISKGQEETILLVEDEKGLREVSRDTLESLGYQVLTAANGKEALQVYQTAEKAWPEQGRRVALVITDVIMPEMGGKRLLQALKKVNPHVKALAITGYVMQEDQHALKEMGFLNVVLKPFDTEILAQVIRQALDAD